MADSRHSATHHGATPMEDDTLRTPLSVGNASQTATPMDGAAPPNIEPTLPALSPLLPLSPPPPLQFMQLLQQQPHAEAPFQAYHPIPLPPPLLYPVMGNLVPDHQPEFFGNHGLYFTLGGPSGSTSETKSMGISQPHSSAQPTASVVSIRDNWNNERFYHEFENHLIFSHYLTCDPVTELPPVDLVNISEEETQWLSILLAAVAYYRDNNAYKHLKTILDNSEMIKRTQRWIKYLYNPKNKPGKISANDIQFVLAMYNKSFAARDIRVRQEHDREHAIYRKLNLEEYEKEIKFPQTQTPAEEIIQSLIYQLKKYNFINSNHDYFFKQLQDTYSETKEMVQLFKQGEYIEFYAQFKAFVEAKHADIVLEGRPTTIEILRHGSTKVFIEYLNQWIKKSKHSAGSFKTKLRDKIAAEESENRHFLLNQPNHEPLPTSAPDSDEQGLKKYLECLSVDATPENVVTKLCAFAAIRSGGSKVLRYLKEQGVDFKVNKHLLSEIIGRNRVDVISYLIEQDRTLIKTIFDEAMIYSPIIVKYLCETYKFETLGITHDFLHKFVNDKMNAPFQHNQLHDGKFHYTVCCLISHGAAIQDAKGEPSAVVIRYVIDQMNWVNEDYLLPAMKKIILQQNKAALMTCMSDLIRNAICENFPTLIDDLIKEKIIDIKKVVAEGFQLSEESKENTSLLAMTTNNLRSYNRKVKQDTVLYVMKLYTQYGKEFDKESVRRIFTTHGIEKLQYALLTEYKKALLNEKKEVELPVPVKKLVASFGSNLNKFHVEILRILVHQFALNPFSPDFWDTDIDLFRHMVREYQKPFDNTYEAVFHFFNSFIPAANIITSMVEGYLNDTPGHFMVDPTKFLANVEDRKNSKNDILEPWQPNWSGVGSNMSVRLISRENNLSLSDIDSDDEEQPKKMDLKPDAANTNKRKADEEASGPTKKQKTDGQNSSSNGKEEKKAVFDDAPKNGISLPLPLAGNANSLSYNSVPHDGKKEKHSSSFIQPGQCPALVVPPVTPSLNHTGMFSKSKKKKRSHETMITPSANQVPAGNSTSQSNTDASGERPSKRPK